MAGTKEGAVKARDTILKIRPNFYSEIGTEGGSKPTTGGFKDRELARRAGAKGGRASRREKRDDK